MSSTLAESRERIRAVLEAGGVRVATTGKLAAPCVLLEAGDPWAEPNRLAGGGRVYRWQLTALGGRADSDAALLELAELVDEIDAALLAPAASRSLSLPTWARPTDLALGGIPYATSIATISDQS